MLEYNTARFYSQLSNSQRNALIDKRLTVNKLSPRVVAAATQLVHGLAARLGSPSANELSIGLQPALAEKTLIAARRSRVRLKIF